MTTKQEIIDSLTSELTDAELDRMVAMIQLKLDKGDSREEIYTQFLESIFSTIEFVMPDLDDEEKVDMTIEIGEKLTDRLMERTGMTKGQEIIPPGLLN